MTIGHVSGLRRRIVVAICLATVAGGVLDSWSYVGHGHVFANAQSGNVVIMAAELSQGRGADVASHLLSFVTFVTGLLLSSLGGKWLQKRGWNSRTARLLVVALLLVALSPVVDAMPDLDVAAAIGFVAAILITSLSHVGRWAFNTGMTTGNMRSAAKALADAVHGDDASWPRVWLMVALCISFGLGAYLGAMAAPWLRGATILCAGLVIAGVALLLARDPDPLPAWSEIDR